MATDEPHLDLKRFYVYNVDGGPRPAMPRVYRIRCYTPEIAPIVTNYGFCVQTCKPAQYIAFMHFADGPMTYLTMGGAKRFLISHRLVKQTPQQIEAKKEPLIVSHLVCELDTERYELAEVFLADEPDGVDPLVRDTLFEASLDANDTVRITQTDEEIRHTALQKELKERFAELAAVPAAAAADLNEK